MRIGRYFVAALALGLAGASGCSEDPPPKPPQLDGGPPPDATITDFCTGCGSGRPAGCLSMLAQAGNGCQQVCVTIGTVAPICTQECKSNAECRAPLPFCVDYSSTKSYCMPVGNPNAGCGPDAGPPDAPPPNPDGPEDAMAPVDRAIPDVPPFPTDAGAGADASAGDGSSARGARAPRGPR